MDAPLDSGKSLVSGSGDLPKQPVWFRMVVLQTENTIIADAAEARGMFQTIVPCYQETACILTGLSASGLHMQLLRKTLFNRRTPGDVCRFVPEIQFMGIRSGQVGP